MYFADGCEEPQIFAAGTRVGSYFFFPGRSRDAAPDKGALDSRATNSAKWSKVVAAAVPRIRPESASGSGTAAAERD